MKVTFGVSGPGRVLSLMMLCLTFAAAYCSGQSRPNQVAPTSGSKVLGEVKLEGVSKVEKSSGVWVDGNYVGFLKELKGDKRLLLLPGEHEIAVRQSGYNDDVQKVVVEPGQDRIAECRKEYVSYQLGTELASAAVAEQDSILRLERRRATQLRNGRHFVSFSSLPLAAGNGNKRRMHLRWRPSKLPADSRECSSFQKRRSLWAF